MKKIVFALLIGVFVLSACAPAVDTSVTDAQLAKIAEQNAQILEQQAKIDEQNAKAAEQQSQIDALLIQQDFAVDAYNDLTEQLKELTATEEAPEATPTAEGQCAIRKYFESLQYGFAPGLSGNKRNMTTVDFGCVFMTIYFGEGSWLFGQITEDGRSLISETCQYYDAFSQKVYVGSDKRPGCDFQWAGQDPFSDDSNRLAADVRIIKKSNGQLGVVCLAEDYRHYSKRCTELMNK